MPGGVKPMGPQKTSLVSIINLSIFQRFFFLKGIIWGLFSAVLSGQRLPLPSVYAFLSRCHSELREPQFLISGLLNHRPSDCAAKIASLFNEESLMIIFFHPDNKHYLLLCCCHIFLRFCCYCCMLLYMVPGQPGVPCKYYCLVAFSQDLCKSWFSEEEIWAQRIESLPKVTQMV